MSFDAALAAMKTGAACRRAGWACSVALIPDPRVASGPVVSMRVGDNIVPWIGDGADIAADDWELA